MQYTMRVVSGGIAGSAFIVLFLGASGLINLLLQYISPITGVARCARTCPAQQPTSLCWGAVQAGSHPSRALRCCCFALGGSAKPAAGAGWLPCSIRGHSDHIQQPPLLTDAIMHAAWLTAQQSPLQDSSRCIYHCDTTQMPHMVYINTRNINLTSIGRSRGQHRHRGAVPVHRRLPRSRQLRAAGPAHDRLYRAVLAVPAQSGHPHPLGWQVRWRLDALHLCRIHQVGCCSPLMSESGAQSYLSALSAGRLLEGSTLCDGCEGDCGGVHVHRTAARHFHALAAMQAPECSCWHPSRCHAPRQASVRLLDM